MNSRKDDICDPKFNNLPLPNTSTQGSGGQPSEHPYGGSKGEPMGMPDSVKKQASRADEILKKILADQDPPPAVPQPAPANTPPVVAPGEPTPIPPIEPVIPPAPAPTEPPVVPPQPAPAKCEDCSKAEHKYSVLQGKYDKEVPRLTYRIAFLENQIDDMKRQVDSRGVELVQPGAPAPGTTSAPPLTSTTIGETLRNSTDEKLKGFRENFPDVFEFVASAVDMAAHKASADTETRLKAVEQKSAKTAQDEFLDIMNKDVPEWQSICQEDPKWVQWLNQSDRYSAKKRLDLLREASAGFNAGVVVNMLNDFKEEMGMGSVPVSEPTTPTPPAQPVFVAPPSGPSQTPSAPAQAEFISRSFIDQFYQDVVKGKYRGRDKEEKAIKAKIDTAVSKGLILNK